MNGQSNVLTQNSSLSFKFESYIDNQISRVQDVVKANNLKMKQALEQNSKTLLTLQTSMSVKHYKLLCTTTDQLSKSLISTELREAHTQLEFKADDIDIENMRKRGSSRPSGKYNFNKNLFFTE